jgi:hypothetical protein
MKKRPTKIQKSALHYTLSYTGGASSSTPEQQRDRSPYWNPGEQGLKILIIRLFGSDNQLPWKLTPDASSESDEESADEYDEDEYEFDDD